MAQNITRIRGINVPKNAALTLKQISYQNERQSTLMAIKQVMGSHLQVISPVIMKLLGSPNSTERGLGERYANILADEFRDKEFDIDKKVDVSRIKQELNRIIDVKNRGLRRAGLPTLKSLDESPTYTSPNIAEEGYTKFLRATQAVYAFAPHLAMEVNLALRSPFMALIKGTMGMDWRAMKQTRDASAIMSLHEMDVVRQDIAAGTGMISHWTKSPTLARIFDKVWHIPLFHYIRRLQIIHAGNVGFHSAIYWAGKLMKGSKMATEELEAMHIDPAVVRMHGGKLDPDELERAMYHYTQQTMFLRSGMHMPITANKNFFMRSQTMYHFFVRAQFVFMRDTFTRMLRGGDVAGIARYIAVAGAVFPNIAPLLVGLETLLRTASPSQAGYEVREGYRKLYHPKGAAEWARNYISLLSHIGAISYYGSLMKSLENYGTLKTIVGSKYSTPIVYLQDIGQALIGMSKKPLGRDILQTVPLVGKPLSHQLLPTKKEEKIEGKGGSKSPFRMNKFRGFAKKRR
jgi:hypothetical protein